MKTVAIVGLFVVVACLQFQANAANCEPEPEGLQNTCHLSICDQQTGSVLVQKCRSVDIPKCQGGSVRTFLPEDLSKPYPECCARFYCRRP